MDRILYHAVDEEVCCWIQLGVAQTIEGYVRTWIDPELCDSGNVFCIVLHELVNLVSHHLKVFL